MSGLRIGFSCLLALAVLLFGLPLGAIEAPAVPGSPAGGAAGPIDLAAVRDAPAVPDAARKAPEISHAAETETAATVTGPRLARVTVPESVAPGVPTPLYLSHCAFLC